MIPRLNFEATVETKNGGQLFKRFFSVFTGDFFSFKLLQNVNDGGGNEAGRRRRLPTSTAFHNYEVMTTPIWDLSYRLILQIKCSFIA